MGSKYLIVHADDFGLSPGISRGILHSLKYGIVSSTSVIVVSPYLIDTKRLIDRNIGIDWGLHVLIQRKDAKSSKDIINETERQLDLFRKTFKRDPSHIDFHKGFKFNRKIYFSLRMFTQEGKFAFRYDNHHRVESEFYGYKNNKINLDQVREEKLLAIFDSLGNGVTELICHPGFTGNRLKDPYKTQRVSETKTLISKVVIKTLKKKKITVINFRDYKTLNTNE